MEAGLAPHGRITHLWRYPVKSMRGEALERAEVGEGGIVGDRAFGVIDLRTGKLLSAKTVPALLTMRASYGDDGHVTMADDGGTTVASLDKHADAWISVRLQREANLERAEADTTRRVDIEIDGTMRDFETRPGRFFDGSSTVHLLTTSSLAAARAAYPQGDWAVERFRPAALIDTGDAPAWAEDDWVGCHLRLGTTTLFVRKACERCVLVTREQPGCPADKVILQTLAKVHDANIGVLCNVVEPGSFAVGDRIELM